MLPYLVTVGAPLPCPSPTTPTAPLPQRHLVSAAAVGGRGVWASPGGAAGEALSRESLRGFVSAFLFELVINSALTGGANLWVYNAQSRALALYVKGT